MIDEGPRRVLNGIGRFFAAYGGSKTKVIAPAEMKKLVREEVDLIVVAAVHPIPAGSKTITPKYSNTDSQGRDIQISMHYKHAPIQQTGFLIRRPAVARVDCSLVELDPSKLVPLVYTADGKRGGCRAF